LSEFDAVKYSFPPGNLTKARKIWLDEFDAKKRSFLAGNLAQARKILLDRFVFEKINCKKNPQRQFNPYMSLNQFEAYVFWPEDRFYYSGGRSNK